MKVSYSIYFFKKIITNPNNFIFNKLCTVTNSNVQILRSIQDLSKKVEISPPCQQIKSLKKENYYILYF